MVIPSRSWRTGSGRFRRLFEVAGLETPDGERKRCLPHMFRDTFAVEMLLAQISSGASCATAQRLGTELIVRETTAAPPRGS